MSFDLQVFNKQTQLALTETVDQSIAKFNEASGGTIVLQNAPSEGDFDIKASFKGISGLVRRRNAYGTGTVESKRLEQLLNVAVKVAAGTPPIEYEPQQYHWILKNPELAAITIGEQLAKARVADMLNAAILGATAAFQSSSDALHLENVPVANATLNTNGVSSGNPGSTSKLAKFSFTLLNRGAAKFGDRSSAIKAWVVHSAVMHTLFDSALTNGERLFSYDNVNVVRDPFGRLFVVTDSPALGMSELNSNFSALGLVENAIVVSGNNDFNSVITPKVGGENLAATYQAEWSYNLGILGYKWNIEQGGKSPNDMALGTSSNWEMTASSIKDTAGVLVLGGVV